MPNVRLEPIYHQKQEFIGIFFSNDATIERAIRVVRGIKWSQTKKCWCLPLEPGSYTKIKMALDGICTINKAALGSYLIKRKKVRAASLTTGTLQPLPAFASTAWNLGELNLQALTTYIAQLRLKAYSPSTIRTYRNEFLQLLQLLKNKHVNDLTTEDLRRYFAYCFETLRLSENTLHSRINAVKFYFEQVLKRDRFFWEIPRPKKALLLPKVLAEAEVRRLFASVSNLKYKAILFTAYSAGLRVSEVVNLKISDIDSNRMQIFVSRAKGKKDRYVMLSPLVLDVLREYLKQCNPRPRTYLFEGLVPGEPYSIKSAQKIFQIARQKAGIKKDVSFHSLRHSFATHLLEKGVDTRYIKDLLGHFSIRTTEIYLHVRRDQLVNILSPLDSLWQEGGKDVL